MPVVGGFSPAPGVRAYSSLKAEVARYVKMPNDTEALAVCGDAILSAIRYYNTKTWKWNLVYQDITLAASTADYSLSTAFKEPRAAELLNASSLVVGKLGFKDPKTFTAEHEIRNQNGTPYYYTAFNVHDAGQVSLDVPCSSGFVSSYPTLRLWYYQRIQHPTQDADTIDVPSEVEGGIICKACEYVAQIYRPDKFQLAETEHEKRWRLLRADNSDEGHDWE